MLIYSGAHVIMIMTQSLRKLVSKQKRRYVEDGFNLDLSYITDSVIAMGFPSSAMEAMYRNKLEDVYNLLESKHKDHYKVYNLCSERSYDISRFHGRVAVYPFDDHHPPQFHIMISFCEDVHKWLSEDKQNVAVVHCKAGKGRTGVMICAYLLHCRRLATANEVLKFYGSQRTHNSKGVTIPSQRRYVDYYATKISENLQYNPVMLYLDSVVIDSPPFLGLAPQEVYIRFEIKQSNYPPYTSEIYQVKRTDTRINIRLPHPIMLVGDVKIEFTQKHKLEYFKRQKYMYNKKLFHFWVNTFFIDLERTTSLTHESISQRSRIGLPGSCRAQQQRQNNNNRQHQPATPNNSTSSSGSSTASISGVGSGGVDQRVSRSAHNSGGGASAASLHQSTFSANSNDLADPPVEFAIPPPRQLRQNLSSGPELRFSFGEGAERAAMSHHEMETTERGIKMMSISDDTLTDQGETYTTQSSFNKQRQRHSSVPMASKSGFHGPGSGSGQSGTTAGGQSPQYQHTRNITGKLMSVRLKKNQIDTADKSSKFSDNFDVTLFLIRPNDPTLQEEFHRSNIVFQDAVPSTGELAHDEECCDSSEDEDEDLAAVEDRTLKLHAHLGLDANPQLTRISSSRKGSPKTKHNDSLKLLDEEDPLKAGASMDPSTTNNNLANHHHKVRFTAGLAPGETLSARTTEEGGTTEEHEAVADPEAVVTRCTSGETEFPAEEGAQPHCLSSTCHCSRSSGDILAAGERSSSWSEPVMSSRSAASVLSAAQSLPSAPQSNVDTSSEELSQADRPDSTASQEKQQHDPVAAHGMVRNQSAPAKPLAHLTSLTHSTWI